MALDFAPVANSSKLMTVEEASRFFDVSVRTMWRWVRDFQIRRYTRPGSGKVVFIDPEELKRKARPVK